MLRVYYTELPQDFVFDERRLILSDYRKEKLRGVKLPLKRLQMLAAESLLNQAVCEWDPDANLPLDIQTGEKGKPFFSLLPLFFSLSHSGPYVACAIADWEIGLDIQKQSAPHETLVKRFFSEDERRFIRESTDRDTAFTGIWCMKESYLKATGDGLSRSMSEVSLDLREPVTLVYSDTVRFWQFGNEHFQMAVCSLDGGVPLPEKIVRAELRP